jgi:putative pyruvate formate lyase activating enzyme
MDEMLKLLEQCELCPHLCGVNRFAGETGFCGAGKDTMVAHYGAHHGEEPPISGTRGSGTIFLSPCNLRCIFCQNYQISHAKEGRAVSVGQLVDIFFELQSSGAHNINLVSPTPYVPQIVLAIMKAKANGLAIPFLYNTNAYENIGTIKALNGLIDIYLPDMKYWDNRTATELSLAPGYRESAGAAILEMKSQVGDLTFDQEGIAQKGLLIRHLVLPDRLAGTEEIVEWIEKELGNQTFISLMSQYSPIYKALAHPIINRRIRNDEYDRVVDLMSDRGFENVFLQGMESADLFVPDFEREEPFQNSKGRRGKS